MPGTPQAQGSSFGTCSAECCWGRRFPAFPSLLENGHRFASPAPEAAFQPPQPALSPAVSPQLLPPPGPASDALLCSPGGSGTSIQATEATSTCLRRGTTKTVSTLGRSSPRSSRCAASGTCSGIREGLSTPPAKPPPCPPQAGGGGAGGRAFRESRQGPQSGRPLPARLPALAGAGSSACCRVRSALPASCCCGCQHG